MNLFGKRWLKAIKECRGIVDRDAFIVWFGQYSTLREAWQRCERGDWLLGIVSSSLDGFTVDDSFANVFHNRRRLRAFCSCARHLVARLPSVPTPADIVDELTCWATSDGASETSGLNALLRKRSVYAALSSVVDAALFSNAGDLYLACSAVAQTACPDAAERLSSDKLRDELLRDCAGIVRLAYPEPPALTWPEADKLRVQKGGTEIGGTGEM